jgi:hypothetical protein
MDKVYGNSDLRAAESEHTKVVSKLLDENASLKARHVRDVATLELWDDAITKLREQLAECKKFSIFQYQAAWQAMVDRGVENVDIMDVIAGFDAAMAQKEAE